MRPTVAEISLPRLCANYRAIRQVVGDGVAIMAVVKANAYGHGAEQVARALAAEGAAWFGVCSVEEGIALRHAGITQPILLLSGFWPGQENYIVSEHLVPAVFDEEQLLRLEEAARGRNRALPLPFPLPFHLKVNTGMGRLGVDVDALGGFLARLGTCRHVRLDGLLTHFASADVPAAEQTLWQIEMFQRVLGELRRAALEPRFIHAANTAALLRFPAARWNMVRPGIGLYGYAPVGTWLSAGPGAGQAGGLLPVPVELQPVLSLKSGIMSLRSAPPGTPLGYGATYVTSTAAQIACVPAGYADGINRLLSNRGLALVRGQTVPIVGRVSMDLTLLDVSAVEGASLGDEVTFIGRQGDAEITAEQVAAWAGTIPYEILCNISPRVPRTYT